MAEKYKLTIAHSPDSDDAFMFYGLATGKIESDLLEFEHILKDIQSLNVDAREGRYDMTAISYHAYPYVADKYVLTAAGSSVGDGYGPVLVAASQLDPADLKGKRIAVPGKLTTAYLAMTLYEPDFTPVAIDFSKIIDAVDAGAVDAGVIIHEGQLNYMDCRLKKVVDLGAWWKEKYNLPLPLGCNCMLRSLPDDIKNEARKKLSESIAFSLANRKAALEYALQFARGLDPDLADRFVGMYVNHHTVTMADEVIEAGQKLLDMGVEAGLIPKRVTLEYV